MEQVRPVAHAQPMRYQVDGGKIFGGLTTVIIELNDVAELSEYYGAGLVDGATIYMVRTVYDLRAARYHLRRFRELLSSPPSALEALPPKPIETDRIVEEARVLAEAKAAKAKAEADRSGLAAGTETEAVAETNGGDGAEAAKSSGDETAAAQQQLTPAQIKERQEAQLAEQKKLTNQITSRMPKMEPLVSRGTGACGAETQRNNGTH